MCIRDRCSFICVVFGSGGWFDIRCYIIYYYYYIIYYILYIYYYYILYYTLLFFLIISSFPLFFHHSLSSSLLLFFSSYIHSILVGTYIYLFIFNHLIPFRWGIHTLTFISFQSSSKNNGSQIR